MPSSPTVAYFYDPDVGNFHYGNLSHLIFAWRDSVKQLKRNEDFSSICGAFPSTYGVSLRSVLLPQDTAGYCRIPQDCQGYRRIEEIHQNTVSKYHFKIKNMI